MRCRLSTPEGAAACAAAVECLGRGFRCRTVAVGQCNDRQREFQRSRRRAASSASIARQSRSADRYRRRRLERDVLGRRPRDVGQARRRRISAPMRCSGSARAISRRRSPTAISTTRRHAASAASAETRSPRDRSEATSSAGRLEIGRAYDFRNVSVTPFAAVQAARLWQAAYTETSIGRHCARRARAELRRARRLGADFPRHQVRRPRRCRQRKMWSRSCMPGLGA